MRVALLAPLLCCCELIAYGEEFYVLQGIDKSHSDALLAAPGVDGFTVRVSWRKLYEEGFDWLDGQIARGDQLDTHIQLRVMAGSNAPDNLSGVTYFEYLSTDESGVSHLRRAPVPWDPTMHLHWQELATQLADRYGANPRIKVVHIPGFAESSEMHLPDEVVLLPGYSSRVVAESWTAMAEPLVSAFPGAIIALNYATPTQAELESADSQWLLDELAAMAGTRAGYQANDLAADVDLGRNKYQTLIEQRQLGRHVGFQMVSPSGSSRFGGDFLDAVSIASTAGGDWLEIYPADVDDIPPAGDYNLNGAVDAADYVVWRNALGSSIDLPTDRIGSKVVTPADYEFWSRRFGDELSDQRSAKSGLPDADSSVVPEANALVMAVIAIAWVFKWQPGGKRLVCGCHRR
jgi:hypothetical protein